MQLTEATGAETTGPPTPPPATEAGWWVPIFVVALIVVIIFLVGWFALSLRGRGPGAGRAWLDYGPFFMVALGIVVALVGFLVTVLFFVTPGKANLTDVLALLAALFGIIGTLVGTYFGIRSSLDVNEGAMRLALGDAPLTVAEVAPQENAENVNRNTNVTVAFSRAVNPASITDQTFRLVDLPGRDLVGGTRAFEAQNTRVTFTPDNPLAAATTYQTTITTGVRDQSGNHLVSEKTWTFTVA